MTEPIHLHSAALRSTNLAGPLPELPGLIGGTITPIDLVHPLKDKGSLSFWFWLPEEVTSSRKVAKLHLHPILSSPGVLDIHLSLGWEVRMTCQWNPENWKSNVTNLWFAVPRLPGRQWMHFAVTWDAKVGIFDGYLNGTPLREAGTKLASWEIAASLNNLHIDLSYVGLAGLQLSDEVLTPDAVTQYLPQKTSGSLASLLGVFDKKPLNWSGHRKGSLLYQGFSNTSNQLQDWNTEGEVKLELQDGCLRMESAKPEDPYGTGNHVVWLNRDLPADFCAEWEVKILSDRGLCIVFFAAKGVDGEDIFDSKLTVRNGYFPLYTRGDINSYHISYYANTPETPGRLTSNLRKNSGFHLVSNGPPSISGHSNQWHTVTLLKQSNHIQLAVDGEVSINWHDDGHTFGPVLGAGKLGFRQMVPTIGIYRNLRIQQL